MWKKNQLVQITPIEKDHACIRTFISGAKQLYPRSQDYRGCHKHTHTTFAFEKLSLINFVRVGRKINE